MPQPQPRYVPDGRGGTTAYYDYGAPMQTTTEYRPDGRGGTTAYINHSPAAPPPVPSYMQPKPQPTARQKAMASLKQAQEEAAARNQKRTDEILALYRKQRNMLGRSLGVGGPDLTDTKALGEYYSDPANLNYNGPSAIEAAGAAVGANIRNINQRYDSIVADHRASMNAMGLGGTTIVPTTVAGLERERAWNTAQAAAAGAPAIYQAQADAAERMARAISEEARFRESITDEYPREDDLLYRMAMMEGEGDADLPYGGQGGGGFGGGGMVGVGGLAPGAYGGAADNPYGFVYPSHQWPQAKQKPAKKTEFPKKKFNGGDLAKKFNPFDVGLV